MQCSFISGPGPLSSPLFPTSCSQDELDCAGVQLLRYVGASKLCPSTLWPSQPRRTGVLDPRASFFFLGFFGYKESMCS